MLLLNGTGIGTIAIGRALVVGAEKAEIEVRHLRESQIDSEIRRFASAVRLAKQGLERLRDELPASAPPELSALLDAHGLMLEDPLLTDETIRIIREQKINAESALNRQAGCLIDIFDNMDDEYLSSKKHDVHQVVEKVQSELSRNSNPAMDLGTNLEGKVIVVNDLTPADTVQFKDMNMAGFITNLGGPISHTAILARSLHLPAVVGLHGACRFIKDDDWVVIDGESGAVVVSPDEGILDQYRRKLEQVKRFTTGLQTIRDVNPVSQDGVAVSLMANIELPDDIEKATSANADGVGLYRTEFMYMNREAPDEEEQYQAYAHVVRSIRGPVTIRTLDLGADKQVDGGRSDTQSANPALGLRAVRMCLGNPGIFVPQLRAILRAAVHGDVRIMIPMLSNLHELEQVLELIREVKSHLSRECVEFRGDVPIGGMIEVPAAAIAADLFARKLDFLSVGTNDLIQYTLAIDRVDDEVNYLYDPLHPSVLRLIRHTIEAGENNNIPVSMCGEMAGDSEYTELLLGLGLREFSMDPAALLEVKQRVIECDVEALRKNALGALSDPDPGAIRNLVRKPVVH